MPLQRLDQTNQTLALRARRQQSALARSRRPRLRRKPPTQQHPRGEALRYRRALLALVDQLADLIRQATSATIERGAAQTRAADPSVRTDAPADDIGEIFDGLEETVFVPEQRRLISRTAGEMTEKTADFNRRQLNRVFESTIGVGIPPVEPYLADTLAAAARENARRITNLLRDQLAQAEETVLSGFRNGLSHREIAKNIQQRVGVTRNRAKLIARDQVSKLNGQLTRQRQTAVGVTEYIWRSSQDERVRETHQDFDGQTYTWAQGSPEGHPGEPINCRCTAEPVLTNLVEEPAA